MILLKPQLSGLYNLLHLIIAVRIKLTRWASKAHVRLTLGHTARGGLGAGAGEWV